MTTAAIPRWAWLILGILAGAAVGHARLAWRAGDLSRYGVQIKGHARFEAALLVGASPSSSSPGASRGLRHPVVYPEVISTATGREVRVQVVAGDFRGVAHGGDTAGDDAGHGPPPWRPAYYVVEAPYRGFGSATAYLDSLRPQGVTYSLAWWCRPLWWYALHALVGAVLVGGVWPTLANRLTYGTWARPADATAPSLPPSPSAPTPQPEPEPSPEQLEAVLDQLEQSASSPGDLPTPPGTRRTDPTPAVRVLSGAPAESLMEPSAAPSKEFGASEADFYPTELKTQKHAPGEHAT